MPVPEAHDFLPHVKFSTYLPALLDPERDANYNLSKRRELLPHRKCSHPTRPESSPQFTVYSLTRTQHIITPVARWPNTEVLKQVADLSSCHKMSAVYYSLWPD